MFWKKLLQWRHLAEIFIFIKMISHVSFISLVHQIVIMSLLISIKLTITKIHHLIWLRFGRSEHKKSQCAQTVHKPIQTSSAKQTTVAKSLLSQYIYIYCGGILYNLSIWSFIILSNGRRLPFSVSQLKDLYPYHP